MRREVAVRLVGLGVSALLAAGFVVVLHYGLRIVQGIALTNGAAYVAAVLSGCVLIVALLVIAALAVAVVQMTNRLWKLLSTVPDPATRVWDEAGQPLEYIGQVTEMPKRGTAQQVVDTMGRPETAAESLHKRSA